MQHEHPLLLGDTLSVICKFLNRCDIITLSLLSRRSTQYFENLQGKRWVYQFKEAFPQSLRSLYCLAGFPKLLPPNQGDVEIARNVVIDAIKSRLTFQNGYSVLIKTTNIVDRMKKIYKFKGEYVEGTRFPWIYIGELEEREDLVQISYSYSKETRNMLKIRKTKNFTISMTTSNVSQVVDDVLILDQPCKIPENDPNRWEINMLPMRGPNIFVLNTNNANQSLKKWIIVKNRLKRCLSDDVTREVFPKGISKSDESASSMIVFSKEKKEKNIHDLLPEIPFKSKEMNVHRFKRRRERGKLKMKSIVFQGRTSKRRLKRGIMKNDRK